MKVKTQHKIETRFFKFWYFSSFIFYTQKNLLFCSRPINPILYNDCVKSMFLNLLWNHLLLLT